MAGKLNELYNYKPKGPSGRLTTPLVAFWSRKTIPDVICFCTRNEFYRIIMRKDVAR